MKSLKICFPGEAQSLSYHTSTLNMRFEQMKEMGLLKEVPTITTMPSSHKYGAGFCVMKVECLEEDYPAIWGMYVGIDWIRNNLEIFPK